LFCFFNYIICYFSFNYVFKFLEIISMLCLLQLFILISFADIINLLLFFIKHIIFMLMLIAIFVIYLLL